MQAAAGAVAGIENASSVTARVSNAAKGVTKAASKDVNGGPTALGEAGAGGGAEFANSLLATLGKAALVQASTGRTTAGKTTAEATPSARLGRRGMGFGTSSVEDAATQQTASPHKHRQPSGATQIDAAAAASGRLEGQAGIALPGGLPAEVAAAVAAKADLKIAPTVAPTVAPKAAPKTAPMAAGFSALDESTSAPSAVLSGPILPILTTASEEGREISIDRGFGGPGVPSRGWAIVAAAVAPSAVAASAGLAESQAGSGARTGPKTGSMTGSKSGHVDGGDAEKRPGPGASEAGGWAGQVAALGLALGSSPAAVPVEAADRAEFQRSVAETGEAGAGSSRSSIPAAKNGADAGVVAHRTMNLSVASGLGSAAGGENMPEQGVCPAIPLVSQAVVQAEGLAAKAGNAQNRFGAEEDSAGSAGAAAGGASTASPASVVTGTDAPAAWPVGQVQVSAAFAGASTAGASLAGGFRDGAVASISGQRETGKAQTTSTRSSGLEPGAAAVVAKGVIRTEGATHGAGVSPAQAMGTLSEVEGRSGRESGGRVSAGEVLTRMDSGAVAANGSAHLAARSVTVGVEDPAHGWIEVRAEGVAGQVAASLSASTAEAHAALHAQLTGMAEYLAEREIGVRSLGVSATGAGDLGASGSGAGGSSGSPAHANHGQGSGAGGGGGGGFAGGASSASNDRREQAGQSLGPGGVASKARAVDGWTPAAGGKDLASEVGQRISVRA